jgi:hypothetical protein
MLIATSGSRYDRVLIVGQADARAEATVRASIDGIRQSWSLVVNSRECPIAEF